MTSNHQYHNNNNINSILTSIIAESIVADPNHAQLQLQKYFQENGLSDEYIEIFQKSWTKTILGHEAFGRGNKKDFKINPYQFARDFIDDVIKHDKDTQHISELISNLQNELQQMKAKYSDNSKHDSTGSTQLLESFHRHTKLKHDLEHMYASTFGKDNEMNSGIQEFQRFFGEWKYTNSLRLRYHIQNYRISFLSHHDKSVFYTPIHRYFHGQNIIKFGEMKRKATIQKNEFDDDHFPVEHIIGISVQNTPEYDSRIWVTYQALSDLIVYPPLNVFPLPIQVQQGIMSTHRMFILECPMTHRLTDMKSNPLAVFLLKYPSVLSLWIYQLNTTRMALKCSNYRMIGYSSHLDTFLRDEDGRLVVGNIAFEEDVDTHSNKKVALYDLWAYDTLVETLCLSRSYGIEFTRIGRYIDEYSSGSSGSTSNNNNSKKNDKDDDNEESMIRNAKILSILEGCELKLELPSHMSTYDILFPENMDTYTESASRTILRVSISVGASSRASTADTFSSIRQENYVSASRASKSIVSLSKSFDSNCSCIIIKGVSGGSITLTLSSSSFNTTSSYNHDQNSSYSQQGNEEFIIHLTVIPRPSIRSAEVVETLGALELAYASNDPSILFAATGGVIENRTIEYIKGNKYESSATVVLDDWNTIRTSVNRLQL